ncbi:glycosyltransferase family 4 protein [Emcibacter sp. SYSU 3D8]|uniref:glycosyltransferase family 4 protein n=1 Tax=Emcibacter sp. SYSU 3D8 TaxID=3133969 RepID=UPI0031FF0999
MIDSGGPLLVAYKAPIHRLHGGDLRIWHLLGGGQADVLCFGRPTVEPVRGLISDPLPWRSVTVERLGPAGWAAATSRAVERLKPSHLIVFIHGRLDHVAWLRDISHPFNAHYVDCRSLAYRRLAASLSPLRHPVKKGAAFIRHRQWLAAETRLAAVAARCILTGAADRDSFAGGGADAVAIGNGTDWTEAPPAYRSRDRGRVLGFHGNIHWHPNLTAIELVCREVLPLVRQVVPDAEFHIAGGPLTPSTRRLSELPGVRFLGYVEDLHDFMSRCDVYVAPMTTGSGVKNKLLEAMAAGMPVVSNPLGAEALDEAGRSLIGIGDDAPAMARLIVDLLASPTKRAEASAAIGNHARRLYGWGPVAQQFRDALVPL